MLEMTVAVTLPGVARSDTVLAEALEAESPAALVAITR